jgi:hypothetical protein
VSLPLRFLPLAAAALLISSCAAAGPQSGTSASPSLSATPAAPAPASDAGLVKASHPQCDLGEKIFHYISTGDSQGDHQLGVAFSKYLGVPADQARSVANEYVQQCDAGLDKKASAPATPGQTDPATLQITQAASCDAIGGTVQGGLCHSTAQGSPAGTDCRNAVVGFAPDGNVDPAALADVKAKMPGCFR